MKSSRYVLFFLALAIAGCAAPPPPKPAFTLVSAEFGLFRPLAGNRYEFDPTHVVPNREGVQYGWQIELKTELEMIRWKEEFQLPEAPKNWNSSNAQPGYSVSADRRTSVTERTVPNMDGVLYNSWIVAPGDPSGPHEMRVYVEGQLVKTFRFVVQ